MSQETQLLKVPRGTIGSPTLELDMTTIYTAEKRLYEVAYANDATAPALMGEFNVASNLACKYLAWIEYEILVVKRNLNRAKAKVILDDMPDEIKKYKEAGVKSSEDFRSALIARDPDCDAYQQILDQLSAYNKLLEGKSWSFLRAHNAAKAISERRTFTPTPNYPSIDGAGNLGQNKY